MFFHSYKENFEIDRSDFFMVKKLSLEKRYQWFPWKILSGCHGGTGAPNWVKPKKLFSIQVPRYANDMRENLEFVESYPVFIR